MRDHFFDLFFLTLCIASLTAAVISNEKYLNPVTCYPNSLLQWHALWHITLSTSIFLLIVVFLLE